MNEKKVIYLITFLFLSSAGMLTPIVLPYFTLEKVESSINSHDLEHSPERFENYTKELIAQNQRNRNRLKMSQRFARWFVPSFTVFVMSGLSLLLFCAVHFYKKSVKPSNFEQ